MHKLFINIFIPSFAIQYPSYTTLVRLGQSLMRLHKLMSVFLLSIFKYRILIEKYSFQFYFILNFRWNNLFIQTSWQIGLHKEVPLCSLSLMYIFRWLFPPGNLSSYHLRTRCFYHLVVFLGSCPLKCSAPRCLLPLIGLFRACLRLDYKIVFLQVLESSYDSLSMFEWYSVSSWHFAGGLKMFTKRMNWKTFTENVNFGQKRCSVENRYLHIECKKHSGVWTSAVMIVLFTIMPSRNSAAELQTVC